MGEVVEAHTEGALGKPEDLMLIIPTFSLRLMANILLIANIFIEINERHFTDHVTTFAL